MIKGERLKVTGFHNDSSLDGWNRSGYWKEDGHGRKLEESR